MASLIHVSVDDSGTVTRELLKPAESALVKAKMTLTSLAQVLDVDSARIATEAANKIGQLLIRLAEPATAAEAAKQEA